MASRVLRWIGPIVALGLLVGACGGSDDGDSPSATPEGDGAPVAGGRLTFAANGLPDCLDVHVSAGDVTAVIGRNLFDTLLAQSPDGKIHPSLASSYETSADATTFTFKLRQGVTFSDGTPLDAAAVKFNLDRIVNPATKSQYAITLVGPYKGSEVVDPTTIRVTFTKPYAPFLQAVTQGFLGIQSPTSINAGNNPCTKPVGSGAFTVKTFTPPNSLILAKNPAYNWAPETAGHQGAAYLDELEIRGVPEDEVRVGSLTSGQVDAIGVVPPASVEDLKSRSGYTVLSAQAPGAPYSLYINQNREPWSDVRARQALQAALDLDAVSKTIFFGQYARAWGPLGPTTPYYDKSVEGSWKTDVNKANGLLDALGYTARNGDGIRTKDGKPLTAVYEFISAKREQRDDVATLIQAQLKKVGIDFRVKVDPINTYLQAIQTGDYDIGEFSFVSGDADVLRVLFSSTNQPSPQRIAQNYAHLVNADIDATLESGAATLDADARAKAYSKVQKYAVDNAVSIPIYVPSYILAAKPGVNGIVFGSQTDPRFYDAWVAK